MAVCPNCGPNQHFVRGLRPNGLSVQSRDRGRCRSRTGTFGTTLDRGRDRFRAIRPAGRGQIVSRVGALMVTSDTAVVSNV